MTRYKKSMFDATMEVLKPSMGAGAYIKDFRKSDAPQFKGKSEKERDKMAIAAYLDARDEVNEGAKNSVISMTKFKNPKIVKQVSDIIKKVGTDKIKVKKIPGGMEIAGSNVHLTQVIDRFFDQTIKTSKGDFSTPALIRMKEDYDYETFVIEQPEHEITVGNYTTKFFHMCGSAQKVMSQNADKEGAEELTRMQDDFYKLEKEVMNAGEATEEQKKTARDMYNKIMAKAGEVGLADEIDDYMIQHIDSIEKSDPKLGVGRTDIKESVELTEKIAGLEKKSDQTGVPYGILKKSYDRGVAAWRTGHRPGTTPQQWAFARVNSMLTGGKADPDLQAKIKAGGYKKKKKAKKEETNLDEAKVKIRNTGKSLENKVMMIVKSDNLNISLSKSMDMRDIIADGNPRDIKILQKKLKEDIIKEDGHMDVPSSIRMCKTIIEDANEIQQILSSKGDENIDTWWTNKLAVAASSLNKLRDYIKNPMEEGRKSKYAQDDEDEEGANKHIVMQLRKTVDLKGNFKTEFEDGKKQKIPLEIARKLSTKYNMLKKPIEKEIFQKRIAKSYRDLLKVAKEK